MRTDILSRLQEARIPPHAYSTTLEQQGQSVLRSIITDRMYVSMNLLKSISIQQDGISRAGFDDALSRFSAELCLSGQTVLFVRAAGIIRELRKYGSDQGADLLNPVLSRLGKGFLVVPDVCSGYREDADHFGLCDFLIDHVALGGALVLGRAADASRDVGYRFLTDSFENLASTFISVKVGKVGRVVKRSVTDHV